MLTGSVSNSIDAKNRIIIPAKFRDELGTDCVVARSLDNCLNLYPAAVWEKETARYASLPRTDETVRAFIRYTIGSAFECEVDKQGRIVIPQFLKDVAHFDKELMTVGAIDRLEIWAAEEFGRDRSAELLSPRSMAEFSDKYQV